MKISVAEIIGILGFLIALLTFILTRLEKRKKLAINIFDGTIDQLQNPSLKEYYPDNELIIIDVINNGTKPVIINKDSIRIFINNITVDRTIDWLNIDESESLLNPGNQIKYGVFTKELLKHVGINSSGEDYVLRASLKDTDSKNYKTKQKFLINGISQCIYKK